MTILDGKNLPLTWIWNILIFAWAVGRYNSGPIDAMNNGTKSTGGCYCTELSPCQSVMNGYHQVFSILDVHLKENEEEEDAKNKGPPPSLLHPRCSLHAYERGGHTRVRFPVVRGMGRLSRRAVGLMSDKAKILLKLIF